jgi:hypothetical protein
MVYLNFLYLYPGTGADAGYFQKRAGFWDHERVEGYRTAV